MFDEFNNENLPENSEGSTTDHENSSFSSVDSDKVGTETISPEIQRQNTASTKIEEVELIVPESSITDSIDKTDIPDSISSSEIFNVEGIHNSTTSVKEGEYSTDFHTAATNANNTEPVKSNDSSYRYSYNSGEKVTYVDSTDENPTPVQPQTGADNYYAQTYKATYNSQKGMNNQNLTDSQNSTNAQNSILYKSNVGQQSGYSNQPDGNNIPVHKSSYEPYNISQPVPKKEIVKKPVKLWVKFITCAACGLIFGLVAGLTFLATSGVNSKESAPETVTETPRIGTTGTTDKGASSPSTYRDTASDVSLVAKNAMPSIVAITNKGVQEVQSMFGSLEQESESSGSGIIVGKNDTELLIVTNNHVVANSTTISVCFIDDVVLEANIKGTSSDNDLAVIAVNLEDISAETLEKIRIAELGDSDTLQVGEPAIAIGNALGYGQSVTKGIISALDREVTVDSVTSTLIQTDAAINPGNSGGALLNINGEVIGINAVKYAASEVEGMGYAIPISTAKPIIDDLMNRTTRAKVNDDERGYLGIQGVTVDEFTSESYNMPTGVYVKTIVEGGGADKAGIQKGDIITKFDGIDITTYDGLLTLIEHYTKGEEIEVVVYKANGGEYEEQTITVTLTPKPAAE